MDGYHGWDIPSVPSTLLGYREFKVWSLEEGVPTKTKGVVPFKNIDNPALASVVLHHVWRSGWNNAKCRPCNCDDPSGCRHLRWHVEPAPQSSCTCGFYARYHVPDFRAYSHIQAVVEAKGRVMLGTEGFRSEHMRIVALASRVGLRSGANPHYMVGVHEVALNRIVWANLATVAEAYGVEYMTFEQMKEKYGRTTVSSVRGLLGYDFGNSR